MHGLQSAAFDSGYLAVLRMRGTRANYKFEQSRYRPLRDVGQLDDSDVDLALKFLTYCYEDPELMPSLDELLSWRHYLDD